MTDAELRDLKGMLMRADIANKEADTAYKAGLLRYEPWKVAFTAFAAGAALVGAMVGLESYLHREPPQQIVVHLDAPLLAPASK